MSVEKPTENWTKFPNSILDNLDKISPAGFKILALMVRKTVGFHKLNERFSFRYIQKYTGFSSFETIRNGLINLIDLGLIKKQENETGDIYEILWVEPKSVTKNVTHENNGTVTEIVTGCYENRNESVTEIVTIKRKKKPIKQSVDSGESTDLIDPVDELINIWNFHMDENLILNKKERGPIYGILKKQNIENIECAIKEAANLKKSGKFKYTFNSIIYSGSNISDLASKYNERENKSVDIKKDYWN